MLSGWFSWVSPALVTAAALGVACSVLSIFVVCRRWAFLGEGIAHAGFGGAGTAWLLALLLPGLDRLAWFPYLGVVCFCLATALAIGLIHRRQRVNADAIIGIFLVASLAWGFLAQQIYVHVTHGRSPAGFDTILFGQIEMLSPQYALMAVSICLAVLLVVVGLRKEILYYCLDPAMAEVSGVRAGFIHYLLIVLVALTIILGIRMAGSVLVPALLILPGATVLLVARRMGAAVALAVVLGLAAALTGPLLHGCWRFLPQGPMIVLALFVEFMGVYVGAAFFRSRNGEQRT